MKIFEKYLATLIHGYTKEGNDMDLLASLVLTLPFFFLLVVMPFYGVVDLITGGVMKKVSIVYDEHTMDLLKDLKKLYENRWEFLLKSHEDKLKEYNERTIISVKSVQEEIDLKQSLINDPILKDIQDSINKVYQMSIPKVVLTEEKDE